MANVKNAILRKKINEVLTDLMVKTTASMVYVSDTETLATTLATLQASLKDHNDKLTALLGEDAASSITGKIDKAIEDALAELQDEDTEGSVGARIKALETAVAEITDEANGVLATAKAYTDEKLGFEGTEFTTVKEYVDTIKTSLNASIAGAFHFKGSVDYVDQLPTEDLSNGDVYQVKYAGTSTNAGTTPLNAEYVYNGTAFEELGSVIDLSAYATIESQTAAILAAKEQAATDATTKANAAQAAAEATAAAALAEYKTENATALAGKGRFIASETEPEDLTENDLWAQIIPDEDD